VNNTVTLFISTFTTLLAIINPLEVMPVFLKLLAGQDRAAHRLVARRACLYATALSFFFLVFGTLLLDLFGVPLDMVRIVGGIILMRLGFSLFQPETAPAAAEPAADKLEDIAFVPLALPLMFGPGAIATIMGMTAHVERPVYDHLPPLAAIAAAILATMVVTYCCLVGSERIVGHLGPRAIDAVSRIVGFFVAAMGMGLVFHGVMGALSSYGLAHVPG
jgi:multiple antibiotic resistance protein